MFTLQVTIENRRYKGKKELFYTSRYKKALVFSNDINCAKLFKTMGSAKGVATRLFNKYDDNPRFEMTGYVIKREGK